MDESRLEDMRVTVEVRFPGARVGTFRDGREVYTLYEVPGGLYKVHTDDGDVAWLEDGNGDGIPEWKARWLWPELFEALGLDEE
jgi:hypothetical protein